MKATYTNSPFVAQILEDLQTLGIADADDLHNRAEAIRRAEPHRKIKESDWKSRLDSTMGPITSW